MASVHIKRGRDFRLVVPMSHGSAMCFQRTRPLLATLSFIGSVCALLLYSKPALCQEALRMSTAADQTAELEKKTSVPDYYNLSLGPVKLRFQGEMGVAFNDNVNYSDVNRQADIILSPGVNVRALWPATQENTLQFSTGIGYEDYLKTTSLSHLYVTPDSALVYKMYVSDFVINFHDRFSLIEDVAQTPTISGTGEFGQLENAAGVGLDWNLYKKVISFSYDHDLMLSTTPNFDYVDHGSELFTLRAASLFHGTSRLGLELGGGVTTYDQPVLNNNTEFSAGPYYQGRLTEHIRVTLSSGYVSYMFSPNGHTNTLINTANEAGNISGYYGDLSLTHQVNTWFNQTLSAGRQLQLGITANLVDLYYVRYQNNWSFIRKVNITSQLLYEHGTTSEGVLQILDIYGGGAGLTYNFTQKLAGSVIYSLQVKKSNPSSFDYFQNQLVFDFKYSF